MSPEALKALEMVNEILEELRQDYEHSEDQALHQQDLYKGVYALGCKEACKELRRRVEMRLRMHDNMVRELNARKRA